MKNKYKYKILDYTWINHHQLADEAMYLVHKQLFPEYKLIPHWNSHQDVSDDIETDITLFGGGDTLPGWMKASKIRKGKLNYCLGIGIQNPYFHNREWDKMDFKNIVDRLGNIGNVVRFVDEKIKSPLRLLRLNRLHITDKDFEKIKNFGFNRIGVRGPLSQEILQQYGISSTIVGDTALYLKPTACHYKKNYKAAINIAQPHHNKWTGGDKYIKEVISFCNSMSDTYKFVILPTYINDVEISKKISRNIKNSSVLDFTTNIDVQGFLDEISTCDLTIGERFHSNVFSACCHVPFISLEYNPKKQDLVRSLGLEEFNIRIDELTRKKLEELFNEIIDNNKNIVNRLRKNVDSLRNKIEDFVSLIKRDIENKVEGDIQRSI